MSYILLNKLTQVFFNLNGECIEFIDFEQNIFVYV